MRILSYVLIFIGLQIPGLGLSLIQSQRMLNHLHHESMVTIESSQDPANYSNLIMQEDDFGITRILEEKEVNQGNELVVSALSISSPPPPIVSDKISLSMGNVLSSLNLNANAFILSKNREIAYVTLDIYGTLKVVDISDLQSPFVIATLSLEGANYDFRVKNMLLSSDERTLYASNSRDLEIIDVTDPSSPKLISLTKSEVFIDDADGFIKISLAIQERTKTLFIGGMGLQVYDISDPKKPAPLKALKNGQEYSTFAKGDLCLSRDEEILFVANGTLDIYNISNPRDMKLISSSNLESSPRSLLLSEDGRTAFLIGISSEYPWNTIFQEVDISNYSSVSVLQTTSLGSYKTGGQSPQILAVSPSKTKFFIFAEIYPENDNLLVFDRVKQTTTKDEKGLIKSIRAMDFSADGRTLITASNGQFMTIELFLDYPNKRIFSKSLDKMISNFSLPTRCVDMKISNDEKSLFIVRRNDDDYDDLIFEVWNMKSLNGPKRSGTYTWWTSIQQIYPTRDSEVAYVIDTQSITRFAGPLDMNTIFKASKKQRNLHFTISSDEKTGFLLTDEATSTLRLGYLTVLDLSNADSSITKASVKLETEFKISSCKLIVKDDKTLIVVLQGGFLIYDISNLESPTKIASFPFSQNEPELDSISPVLSPDQKTLYIETVDKTAVHKLRIYDLSNRTAPQLIGEKDLAKRVGYFKRPGFSLSPDLKSGFIAQDDSLLRLNVTNPKEITVSGIIPLSDGLSNYVISPDGQTLSVSFTKEIRVFNMNMKYSLFLKQEKFMLGEKYSSQISILNLTGASDYNLLDSEAYKITKLSLIDINILTNQVELEAKTSSLPSWITFDRESDSLIIEAKKQLDINPLRTEYTSVDSKISIFGPFSFTILQNQYQ